MDSRVPVGTRVKLTVLGSRRLPRCRQGGVVTSHPRDPQLITVLVDGLAVPRQFNVAFWRAVAKPSPKSGLWRSAGTR